MLSLVDIAGVFAIACLIGAMIIAVSDGIWDNIEDDVAKQEGCDKIKK